MPRLLKSRWVDSVSGLTSAALGVVMALALARAQDTMFRPPELAFHPVQVRVLRLAPPAAKAPAPAAKVLPVPAPVQSKLPVQKQTPQSSLRPPVAPPPAKEPPATPPQEFDAPSTAPSTGSPLGEFTSRASLDTASEPLPQANPATTPDESGVVLEVVVNDQGVVVSSRVKVASSKPLVDATLALVAIGKTIKDISPPLQPGETRTLDIPIHYGPPSPASPASSASSANSSLP